jgi:hypothetical protein
MMLGFCTSGRDELQETMDRIAVSRKIEYFIASLFISLG